MESINEEYIELIPTEEMRFTFLIVDESGNINVANPDKDHFNAIAIASKTGNGKKLARFVVAALLTFEAEILEAANPEKK